MWITKYPKQTKILEERSYQEHRLDSQPARDVPGWLLPAQVAVVSSADSLRKTRNKFQKEIFASGCG